MMDNSIAMCAAILLLIIMLLSLVDWIYRWANPKCSFGKLPPGSMGIPLLGETFQFFRPNITMDVSQFIKKRVKRYGPVFKTSLVGRPVVVSTDPDINYIVFQEEGRLFESWYPDTFTEIFGRENVGSQHGFMYKYLKKLVLKLYGPESLKRVLLHEVEKAAKISLSSWSNQPSFDLKDSLSAMIFNLSSSKLISYDPSKSSKDLRRNFDAFIRGLISFPLDVPGTAYHQCLQGRKNAMRLLKRILNERRESPRSEPQDFFDYVIEELKTEQPLITEAIALDLMFVLLFASFETTSLVITLAVRLLTENPKALEELTEEHEAIIKNRENPESEITWKEYKSMTFTFQVIMETARLANIVPVIFRKALKTIEIKGYTIPEGWGVMVCPPAVHLNPDIYKDPLTFNPWRWKDRPEMNGGSKHFMAFGGGMRFCVGTDFTKLQMAIFFHCLVTKYRWTVIKGGNTVRTPGLAFPDGYHIKLTPKK